jgi:endogenous inhibitor of DNA gyrase (YacG/DUF329 family)
MFRGRCPICAKPISIARLDDLPSFPFCSPQCRQVDLGRWIDGSYVIPGPPAAHRANGEQEPTAPGEGKPDIAG